MSQESNKNEKKKRVVMYIRVSTTDQVEMYGVDLQKEKILRYIELRDKDLEFAGDEYVYVDEAVSGASDIDERPELMRLFNDLKHSDKDSRPFDTVVVYKIDRFARKLNVLLQIVEDLNFYKTTFASAVEAIDTGTAFGTAMLGILGVFAELERDMIRERTHDGRIQAIKNGCRMRNRFGYKRTDANMPLIYEAEALVVQEIFNLFVHKDHTVGEITRILRERNRLIPTASELVKKGVFKSEKEVPKTNYKPKNKKNGRKYQDAYLRNDKTIRDILSNEIYIGIHYYNKSKKELITDKKTGKIKSKTVSLPKEQWEKAKGGHEPIIEDLKLFEEAQQKLGRRGGPTKADQEYVLSGLLKCDHCKEHRINNNKLQRTGTKSGKQTYYYQCQGKSRDKYTAYICPVTPLEKNQIEQFVVEHVKSIFKNPKIFVQYLQQNTREANRKDSLKKERESLSLQRAKQEMGISNIKKMFSRGDIDEDAYNELTFDARTSQRELSTQISKLSKQIEEIVDYQKYKHSYEMLTNIVGKNLPEIFKDPKTLKKFLRIMVEEIIIHSRELKPGEKMPGRKRKGLAKQLIPSRLEIVMRLPQDVIKQLFKHTQVTTDTKEEWRRVTGSDGRYWNTEANDISDDRLLSDKDMEKLHKLERSKKRREEQGEEYYVKMINRRSEKNPKLWKRINRK